MNLKDKIAVMQAFVDGQVVQVAYKKNDSGEWVDEPTPSWNWGSYIYRVKPKIRYLNVYTGTPVKPEWSSLRPDVVKLCVGHIGYLEDKQDGSPYIFHQL